MPIAQSAFHGGHEMLHLRVLLQPHQLRHLHAAKFAHAPKVIAQQVGDHHQLRTFLFAGLQFVSELRITLGIRTARPGTLDGARLDVLSAEAQKSFRAGGGDLKIACIQERSKRRRAGDVEGTVKAPTITRPRSGESLGEVYLINVSGADVVECAADGGSELVAGEVGAGRGGFHPAGIFG